MDLEEEINSPFQAQDPLRRAQQAPTVEVAVTVLESKMTAVDTPRSYTEEEGKASAKPKLGGLIGNAVWIGGPPRADFSGPSLASPPTPLCFRDLSTDSEIKGYIKRTTGHSVKFKRDDQEFNLFALLAHGFAS